MCFIYNIPREIELIVNTDFTRKTGAPWLLVSCPIIET